VEDDAGEYRKAQALANGLGWKHDEHGDGERQGLLRGNEEEREAVRPEYLKTQVLTDPHAPAPWRNNGPLSNFEPFYKTFSVKKDDKLYRPSSSRASMW